MPNVMAALPNIGGALCSTLQFALRPLLECRAVIAAITEPVEISWCGPNYRTDLSRWAEVYHIVATCGGDIAV